MGRSNIKQVAEKRRLDIEKFLVSLFRMADEISHSDLVYTFFHPLLRDQEEVSMASINATKFKGILLNPMYSDSSSVLLAVPYIYF